ncbi:hypothetical protein AB0P05_21850 [Streptomyces flaveolus]|uniref:hypothetical protein n=1 Tax=Streptomyces flaveolus TaxID=67297 RepID=UPI00342430E2
MFFSRNPAAPARSAPKTYSFEVAGGQHEHAASRSATIRRVADTPIVLFAVTAIDQRNGAEPDWRHGSAVALALLQGAVWYVGDGGDTGSLRAWQQRMLWAIGINVGPGSSGPRPSTRGRRGPCRTSAACHRGELHVLPQT